MYLLNWLSSVTEHGFFYRMLFSLRAPNVIVVLRDRTISG